MTLLFSYNLALDDVDDLDFHALYAQRRRDANFAGAIEKDGKIYAFRDHLGIIPLYFRYTSTGVQFAMDFDSLLQEGDTVSQHGIDIFTKFATVRFAPLIEQIHIVPPGSVIEIDPRTQTQKLHYQYEFQPHQIPFHTSWNNLTDQFKELMLVALKRTVQHNTVGLYLSGGIDSALIAILLRELGVTVNGYTSGPWGKESSDIQYARLNAETIKIARHEFDFLETDDYRLMMEKSHQLFQLPKGIPTTIGVTSLWENTSIDSEKQLYFGQNCDNIMGSMTAQYLTLFLQPFPRTIRQRFHPALKHDDLISNYLHLSKNFTGKADTLSVLNATDKMNPVQQLIIAAMATVGNSSSEIFTQPSLTNEIAINNPYHDVDVVEFTMGIPFMRRLGFARRRRFPIPILEKNLIQRLASRYLPATVVERKKAFTVSFKRDDVSRQFYDSLPHDLMGIQLTNENERFAGAMLKHWLQSKKLLAC